MIERDLSSRMIGRFALPYDGGLSPGVWGEICDAERRRLAMKSPLEDHQMTAEGRPRPRMDTLRAVEHALTLTEAGAAAPFERREPPSRLNVIARLLLELPYGDFVAMTRGIAGTAIEIDDLAPLIHAWAVENRGESDCRP